MRALFALTFFVFAQLLVAQELATVPHDWEENPQWEALPDSLQEESAVITFDHHIIEFAVESETGLAMYETLHRRVRVNNDEAIEAYNKVFLPLGPYDDLVNFKGRAVSKSGEVTNLSRSDVKEQTLEDGLGTFKMAAFEGVDQESDLEYWYTIRKSASFFGREVFQDEYPVLNASFTMVAPDNLIYLAKPYNGFAEIEENEKDGKRWLKGKMDFIPAMAMDEKYASVAANRHRVEYKISHNASIRNREMFTWNEAAARFHEIFYPIESKDRKVVEKIWSKLKVADQDAKSQILAIENYLKNNFAFKESLGNVPLADLVKAGVVDEKGVVRLTVGLLTVADIDHELVLTTDREEVRFDKDFMSWNYLENFLVYFPEFKQFMAPAEPAYRFGLYPYSWSDNEGLFIKQVVVGDVYSAYGKVKEIPSLAMEEQYDNMVITVRFPEDLQEAVVEVERTFSGENAMFIQPYYDLATQEDQQKIAEDLLRFVGEDADVVSSKVTNHNKDQSPLDEPFTLAGQLEVSSVVDKAGKDYLLKIGNLIGTQVEMYQEDTRVNPVEIEYPHEYKRTITVELPAGYTLKGTEALAMDISHGEEMGFRSSYELTDTQLVVTIYEYYAHTRYPLERFEEFRAVINAAADFNKIVLVLEKA